MPEFGPRSRKRLSTCHPYLIEVCEAAIRVVDFAVLCGYRGEEEQDEYFATGRSLVRFPKSKHNIKPSLAVDIAPWPIDWEDTHRFHHLAGVMETCAYRLGIRLIWGGRWKRLVDMPHYELAEPLVPPEPPDLIA